jgi:uncharacterized protein YndB with AHSA1/START domain
MSDVLKIQAHLAAPLAVVYRALTDASAMRTWLAEFAETDLDGNRYAFWGRHTPQGERDRQRLLEVEPERVVAFEWTLDDTSTKVEFVLEPDGDGKTKLAFRQDGQPTMAELMAPPGRRDGLHAMHTFWPLAIANLAEYVEGRPLTPKADFTSKRANEVRTSFTIDAPPDKVFESLVDPAAIKRWWGWEVEVEPRVGGKMQVGVDGKIFEFEPNRRLSYKDDEGAVVRWELEGSGGKTHLTFVQSGYSADEWDDAAQHEAGWLASFAELKRMHELGDAWTPLTTEIPDGDG